MHAITKRDGEAARKACVAHVHAAGTIALKRIRQTENELL